MNTDMIVPATTQKFPPAPHNTYGGEPIAAGHIDTLRSTDPHPQTMQNLRNHTTTLLDPNVRSQEELYGLCERLSNGLPGLTGNTLLLLRLGVPTPSADLTFPQALREQMTVQFYLDARPGKHFIRHERPASSAERSGGGPVHRLWLSRLPIPQKHQVFDRLGV